VNDCPLCGRHLGDVPLSRHLLLCSSPGARCGSCGGAVPGESLGWHTAGCTGRTARARRWGSS
jgi:hypothetical protein